MIPKKILLLLVALVVNCDSKPEAYGEYSFNRPNLPFFTSYKNLSPNIAIQSNSQHPAINVIADDSKSDSNVPCDNNESHKSMQLPTVVIIYPEVEKIPQVPCDKPKEPCNPNENKPITISPPPSKTPEPCPPKEIITTTTQPPPTTTKAPEPCRPKEITTMTPPPPPTKGPEPCPPEDITTTTPQPPSTTKAPKPCPPEKVTTTIPFLPKEVKLTAPPTSTSQSPKPCPLLPKDVITTRPPQKLTRRIPLPPPTKAPEPCAIQPPPKVTTRISLPPPTKAPEPCAIQPPPKVTTRIPLPPPTKAPEPCAIQPHPKVTTRISLPPPTKAPEPCAIQPPPKVTIRIPLPPPTKAPDPCATQPPQKVATRIPLPPRTKVLESRPTQVLVKAQENYQPAMSRGVMQSNEILKPVSSLKSSVAISPPARSVIPPVHQISTVDSVPTNCVNGEIYAANAASCDQYIICYFGKALLMNCPAGLAFNQETKSCDWTENVPSCNPRAFEGFTCPHEKYNDHIDNFRYGESCRQYVACHKGKPRLLSCDDGSFFDDDLKACIDAENVTNCKDILY